MRRDDSFPVQEKRQFSECCPMRVRERGEIIALVVLSLCVFFSEAAFSEVHSSAVHHTAIRSEDDNGFRRESDLFNEVTAFDKSGDTISAPDKRAVLNGEKSTKAAEPTVRENQKHEIENLTPRAGEEVSLFMALTLDVTVPGGGHFYTGDYYWGITFCALKLLSVYSVYYFYNEWQFRRSLYNASKRADEEMDPSHELEFEDPDGGYKTVEEFRREYDAAAQRITFAIVATLAVYTTSAILVYFNVKRINEKKVPTFPLQVNRTFVPDIGEEIFSLCYTRRF